MPSVIRLFFKLLTIFRSRRITPGTSAATSATRGLSQRIPPATPFDFHGASIRHYEDAKFLMRSLRNSNSGHLFGLSAECGVKALLIGMGHPTDQNGDMASTKLRGHIHKLQSLQNQFLTFANGRNASQYYARLSNMTGFSNWDINHRYFSESRIPQSLSSWENAADQIRAVVALAYQNGDIP